MDAGVGAWFEQAADAVERCLLAASMAVSLPPWISRL
jgi:hypothetical protein